MVENIKNDIDMSEHLSLCNLGISPNSKYMIIGSNYSKTFVIYLINWNILSSKIDNIDNINVINIKYLNFLKLVYKSDSFVQYIDGICFLSNNLIAWYAHRFSENIAYCKFKESNEENNDNLIVVKQDIIDNKHKDRIQSFSYNYDTKTMISIACNGTVCIYDITERQIMTLK